MKTKSALQRLVQKLERGELVDSVQHPINWKKAVTIVQKKIDKKQNKAAKDKKD